MSGSTMSGASSSQTRYPHDRFLSTSVSPDSFWGRWRDAVRQVSLPVQLQQLKTTGRYDCFNLEKIEYYKRPMAVWPVPQHLFWESDCAKIVEALAYLQAEHPDEEQRQHIAHLVDLIEKAQQPDGYLNVHFVVNEPEKRWSNLRDLHELYNGGHLIEAALAHHKLTGSEQFLNVMLRFVKYVASVFGPESEGKLPGYPGHPEIELALMRLYHRTGDQTSLDLARFFLTERGRDGGKYYVDEQARRGEHPQLAPEMMPKKGSYWYMQAHKLIKEQEEIEGHAVRAMYLLTAVADFVETRESAGVTDAEAAPLKAAVYRLWDNMVSSKMYVTGGIGSVKQWEGFSIPYSLPQSTDEGGCYAETCAAIGIIMLSERMLAMQLDSRVADVAERALYNASVTTGMSVDGRSFTYENQLASCDKDLCNRHEWFECACCPPNVLRTLGVIGGFFWSALDRRSIAIHHYYDGEITHGDVKVTLRTKYPWSGTVHFDVQAPGTAAKVLVRIPDWAGDAWSASPQVQRVGNGYIELGAGETTLELPLHPRFSFSHPHTGQDLVTLHYGPLVYCLEDTDNAWVQNHFKDLTISASYDLSQAQAEVHDGVTYLRLPNAGYHREPVGYVPAVRSGGAAASGASQARVTATMGGVSPMPAYVEKEGEGKELLFIPYYFRANRERKAGVQMRTSLRRKV